MSDWKRVEADLLRMARLHPSVVDTVNGLLVGLARLSTAPSVQRWTPGISHVAITLTPPDGGCVVHVSHLAADRFGVVAFSGELGARHSDEVVVCAAELARTVVQRKL